MNKYHARLSLWLGATLLTMSLGGCGGGGSSGVSGGNYTGNTNPATITNNNGGPMVTRAYTGGLVGGSMGSFATAVTTPTASDNGAPSLTIALYHHLHHVAQNIDLTAAGGTDLSHAQRTFKDTIPSTGTCGGASPTGNLQVDFNVDDTTGNFSGTGIYNGYCVDGVKLTGAMSMTGKIDVNTEKFITLSIILENITSVSANDNFTVNGHMAITSGAPTETVSMDLVLRDNATQKGIWLKDMVLAVTTASNHQDFTLSGRFYHHDEGYVDVNTMQALRINSGDIWPSTGRLVAVGKDGGKATLIVLSNTTFEVDLDTNGDGTTDLMQTFNWPS